VVGVEEVSPGLVLEFGQACGGHGQKCTCHPTVCFALRNNCLRRQLYSDDRRPDRPDVGSRRREVPMTESATRTDSSAPGSGRSAFEIGHMTFVEITTDPVSGETPSPQQRTRDTIEQARLADQVGLDLFAV